MKKMSQLFPVIAGVLISALSHGESVVQEAYLKPSNDPFDGFFGASVAISGDTAVVGAPFEFRSSIGVNGDQALTTGNTDYSGSAYVFVRTDGVWTQQAYLKASNTGQDDWFGWAVDISGDTIVVSARDEDSQAAGVNGNQANNDRENSGAAYVFVRNAGVWTQQAYLKASNPGVGDRFGNSVAVSNDVIVVGSENEDSGSTGVNGGQADDTQENSGAAYVFERSGNAWTQTAYLKASNTLTANFFGHAVAASGSTLVVGAPGETGASSGIDGNQTQSPTFYFSNGAAYVFVKSSGVWTQQAYVKPSNTSLGNMYFGSSVAIAEDCMVIGAPSERCSSTGVNGNQFVSDPNPGFGAAYVFRRVVSTWNQEAYLKASNSEANDSFGSDVAVSGDRVVVSAPNEKSAATGVDGNQADNSIGNAGAAYAFDRDDGVWSQRAYLKASNTDDDTFGTSVAVSGGVALAGAPHEDSDATGINGDQNNEDGFRWGAAYAFYFDETPPLLPEIVVEQPAGNSLADGDSEITFPSVEIGKSSKLEFKVKNIGQAPLENITASLHGKNAAQFVIVSQPASSLAGPDGSSNFFVRFAPKTIGPKSAILRIASNDANESAFDLTLTGNTFIPPVPEIDVKEGGDVLVDGRKTKAYGKVKVGAFGAARKFVIENKGGANLSIKLTRRGANKNDFLITLPTLFKTVLKPGQTTFFWVNFKPKATGSRYAEIHIQNNDTDENPFDFRVTGFGIK